MPPRVAALTMAYNEADLLPIWARHYARQVGADQCFVIGHGSSEDVRLPPGVNRLRLPRSAHDDERRAQFVSELAASLLRYFDWVLYSDVDELLLADPAIFPNLPAFCAAQDAGTVTTIGLDVQHVPTIEPPLDPHKPVGGQRGWARFSSALCKPALTSRPVSWSPGFHCSAQPLRFAALYLFHLHWADQAIGLRRLQKTRRMAWADDRFGGHQRLADASWLTLFQGMSELPRRTVPFGPEAATLESWLDQVNASRAVRDGEVFNIDVGLNAAELWAIPHRFRTAL